MELGMALHHATSGEVVTLEPLGPDLPESRTRALVKTEGFEAIRLVLAAGDELPPHVVSGQFTLHCLEGLVTIDLADSSIELSADQWVYFDGGVTHGLRSSENSSLLLTILLPASGHSLAHD
jgi:quercetin dioxygenase-like cupin family protein